MGRAKISSCFVLEFLQCGDSRRKLNCIGAAQRGQSYPPPLLPLSNTPAVKPEIARK
jgi:hypothetical protein